MSFAIGDVSNGLIDDQSSRKTRLGLDPVSSASSAFRGLHHGLALGIVAYMIRLPFRKFLMAGMAAVVLQAPAKSVWDGVYTNEQAARGNAAFMKNCSSCHDVNSEFSGSAFMGMFKGQTAFDVYDTI